MLAVVIDGWALPSDPPKSESFITVRPEQNGRHNADVIFKGIFLNEKFEYSNKIWLKYVCKGVIDKMINIGSSYDLVPSGNKP